MKIGIALSGGGSKGFAHLGVLKALEEAGITPDIISGTSAGSIVGAFIASGKKPDEVLTLVKNNKFLDYAKVSLPRAGLFTLDNIEKSLKKHLTARFFSGLKIPLFVAVSNLNSGSIEYLRSGPLIPAIQASCSIPVLFSPVEIRDNLYVDGGLLDNLPYRPLIGRCDKVIAINIVAGQKNNEMRNVADVTTRVFEIIVNKDRTTARQECTLLIEPTGLEAYRILDTSHADEMFSLGYEYCKKHVDLSDILN